jgi:hypothetical protein
MLLNEGVDCWRPVKATKISESVYVIEGIENYDPDDEEWEFLPGSRVFVENHKFSSGATHLVAIKACTDD